MWSNMFPPALKGSSSPKEKFFHLGNKLFLNKWENIIWICLFVCFVWKKSSKNYIRKIWKGMK